MGIVLCYYAIDFQMCSGNQFFEGMSRPKGERRVRRTLAPSCFKRNFPAGNYSPYPVGLTMFNDGVFSWCFFGSLYFFWSWYFFCAWFSSFCLL